LIKTIVYKTGSRPNINKFQCIYATPQTTLSQITASLQHQNMIDNPKKLIFRSLFHSILPRIKKKGLGILYGDKVGEDDHRTLEQLRFRTGDYLEVEVFKEDIFKEFEQVDKRERERQSFRQHRARPY
jgi:hypothetical protein